MKKLLLASAVAALSVSAAQAAPTLYGKAHMGINAVDADNSDTSVAVDSHGSRLGFKGSEPLTANTDLIYLMEYGVNLDESNVDEQTILPGDANQELKFNNKNSQFYSRHTYVGLDNANLGTFRLGYQYGVTDVINNVTVAAAASSGTSSDLSDGNRVANSLLWTAPKGYNLPVELNLMAATEEENGDAGMGGAIMYDQGTGFTAGLAYTQDLEIDGQVLRATAKMDMAKLTAMPLELGLLYQQAEMDGDNTNQEEEILISAAYDIVNTPWTAWAEYDMVNDLGGSKDSDLTRLALGGDYKFNASTTGHVYGAIVSSDVNGVDSDINLIGTSLEYKF